MPASIKANLKSEGMTTEIPVTQPSGNDVQVVSDLRSADILVGVTIGHTKNLGNYESLNVVVSRSDYTSHPDETNASQLAWCLAKMDATFEGILGSTSGVNTAAKPAEKAAKINPAAKFQIADDLDL